MTTQHQTEVSALIEDFLHSNPSPSKQDWRALIEGNQPFSEQILDYAQAYKQSRSVNQEMDDEPLDEALFNVTKSQAMALVYANNGPVNKAVAALDRYKGPAARDLAASVGLAEHVSLLNQIIRGDVLAPYVLLKRIALNLHVQIAAVAQTFSVNFQNQPARAYKSAGKPALTNEPITWAKAVQDAGIRGAEAERLIALEKALD